jgi:hypothetical protein
VLGDLNDVRTYGYKAERAASSYMLTSKRSSWTAAINLGEIKSLIWVNHVSLLGKEDTLAGGGKQKNP